jgi:hypothetical protein
MKAPAASSSLPAYDDVQLDNFSIDFWARDHDPSPRDAGTVNIEWGGHASELDAFLRNSPTASSPSGPDGVFPGQPADDGNITNPYVESVGFPSSAAEAGESIHLDPTTAATGARPELSVDSSLTVILEAAADKLDPVAAIDGLLTCDDANNFSTIAMVTDVTDVGDHLESVSLDDQSDGSKSSISSDSLFGSGEVAFLSTRIPPPVSTLGTSFGQPVETPDSTLTTSAFSPIAAAQPAAPSTFSMACNESAVIAPAVMNVGAPGSSSGSLAQTHSSAQTSPGLTINITYDSSVDIAPAGFKAVVASVVQLFENEFSNPVTLNIDVGWGEVAGSGLDQGVLGESESFLDPVSYSQLLSALVHNATSGNQLSAVNTLPSNAPASGQFYLTAANATALGLISSSAILDGYVGFGSSVPFAYNNSNGIPAGEYDLFGVVAHEISEVLGRISMLTSTNSYSNLDLFRYSAPGVRSFVGGTPTYFSIDGGNTNLDSFNSDPNGDFGDWASSAGNDSFSAFGTPGVVSPVTSADLTLMNILGYNLTSLNPQAPTITAIMETPSGGDLNAGKNVSITLDFSAAVNVAGGTPTLTLNDGGTATYSSGSGSAGLTFTYTVGTHDLNVTSLAAIAIHPNNAAISDATGSANLSLSGLSQSGPRIDTTIPQLVSIGETPSAGVINSGQVVVFTLKLTEAVTVSGAATLALNDGGTATFTGGSGSQSLTFSYMVSPTDSNVSALAAIEIDLNGGSIQDAAGNSANLSLAGMSQAGPQIDAIPTTTLSPINQIYQAVLQRAPSNAETDAANAIDATIGNAGLVAVVVDSPEAQQNVDPIVQIILLATGNLPTPAQLAGWVPAVEAGTSLVQMATAFVASTAFADTYNAGTPVDPNSPITRSIVQAIIEHALGTQATSAQVDAWVNSGLTVDQVFVDFALGEQYTAASQATIRKYLTAAADQASAIGGLNVVNSTTNSLPTSQTSDIYHAVLQRAPTDAEVTAASAIDSTIGSAGVIAAVVDTPEAQQDVYPIVQIILLATGDLPRPAQLAGWVPAVEAGTSLVRMATAFVASTAFADTYNSGAAVDPNSPITASISQAIIAHATGTQATSAQVDAWVSSGLTVDQVFVDFALGDQYAAAVQPSVQQYLIAAAVNGAGLTTIDATATTGSLTLGLAAAPLMQAGLTILGGSGTLSVVASGASDTISELNTSAAGGTITAAGTADTINAANGANTIIASGAGDFINLGVVSSGVSITAAQTIHAAGAGDTITFATQAANGAAVAWGSGASSTVDGGSGSPGIGAHDRVNFGNNTGSGSETAVLTGDLTGASTSGGTSTAGIAMTTLGNVVDAHGDQIVFNNATTEVLAHATGSNAVTVASAASLAQALDMAAASAAASQTGGLIAAHSGVIDWFQYSGNTYVVEAINATASAASHSALSATDEVVKIVGLINLSGESFASHTLVL